MLLERVLPLSLQQVSLGSDGTLRVVDSDILDGVGSDVESRGLVKSEHRPGSGGRTLLDVTEDGDSVSTDGLGTEDGPEVLGEAVEVEDDGLVGGEEVVEGLKGEKRVEGWLSQYRAKIRSVKIKGRKRSRLTSISESVRVGTFLSKDHQVLNVDVSDSDTLLSKESRGSLNDGEIE